MKLHTSHDDVQGKKYDNDEFLSLSISILILTKHQNGHKKTQLYLSIHLWLFFQEMTAKPRFDEEINKNVWCDFFKRAVWLNQGVGLFMTRVLTWCINCWCTSFMTHTIWTLVSVGTGTTTVTTIKVATCIVGFIIAVSIWDQVKWTITGIMWVAYTINTNLYVDIGSTTITSIIVAFCGICMIMTITVTDSVRGFTALKINIKLGPFQIILWK